jgi:MFS family permease
MAKTKEEYAVSGTTEVKAPLVCSLRLLLAFLAFFGFFLCYAQRNGLAVGIVCMVNPDADNNMTSSNTNDSIVSQRNIPASCHKHSIEKIKTASQVLLWPKQTRGIILGSFYWGYALTQIASSVAVNFLGPKKFLAILIFVSSIATIFIPVFSKLHPSVVILLRVLAGAAQV